MSDKKSIPLQEFHALINFTREHFYARYGTVNLEHRPLEEFRLDRSLNYYLCNAIERIYETFGEVSRREVVMLAEAWLISRSLQNSPRSQDVEDKLFRPLHHNGRIESEQP